MGIKFCCLPGILQKQRKFVTSFQFTRSTKFPSRGPSFFKLPWETGSQPNSRIVITFSDSDSLKGIWTQAKHFLGSWVLFPHPPPYAACALMGTAIFDHSIFSWLLNTDLNRIDSFTNQNTGIEEEEDYCTYGLQELFFLCKFSFWYLKALSRSVKAQWCIIVYNKNNIPR